MDVSSLCILVCSLFVALYGRSCMNVADRREAETILEFIRLRNQLEAEAYERGYADGYARTKNMRAVKS